MKELILIPTDFSKNAQNATDYGIQLFDDHNVEFVLLHTFYIPYASLEVSIAQTDITLVNAQAKFKEELKRIKLKFPNKKASLKTRFEIGDVARVIDNIEKEVKLRAIIMGTKGSSGFQEVLMGSRTAAVIEKVKCPFLCIPQNASFKKIERIVFANDYREVSEDRVLAPLHELAKRNHAEIFVLNIRNERLQPVSAEESNERFELHSYLDEIPHNFYHLDNGGIESSIQDFVNKNRADLIVMVKRERSLLQKLFNKSQTKLMAFHTDIPLLVLHDNKN